MFFYDMINMGDIMENEKVINVSSVIEEEIINNEDKGDDHVSYDIEETYDALNCEPIEEEEKNND